MQRKIYHRHGLRVALIVLLTLLLYIPALQGGFIWDDNWYVTDNPKLRSTEGLARIWVEPRSSPQYYPLVFSTFWVEYQMWGLDPAGYHLVNVLLHAVSAVLLYLLLSRLKVPGAWLASVVFALHPVQVESVAWITERKNVLSGLFYFGSTLCLFRFFGVNDKGREPSHRWWWYGSGLLLFICALLSKTVTCSLPAAMLLVLWWKHGRVRWPELLALVPFFIVGVVLGLFTIWLERHHVGAQGLEWQLSFVERFLVAGRALWFYAWKLVWPAELTFNYQRWQINAGMWWQYGYPLAVLLVVSLLWAFRDRLGRGPLVAVLFFCGTLFPALGFFDVYPFRFSFVADHFQYLASVGLIVLAVGGLTHGAARMPLWPKRTIVALGLLALLLLATQTWRQGQIYADSETLWRDTLAKNPESLIAHNNLGSILRQQGKHHEAMVHFSEALRIRPDAVEALNNLGISLDTQGRQEEAVVYFTEALRLKPNYVAAHNNLGVALTALGKLEEAIAHLSEALRLNPQYAEAHNNLGIALTSQGKPEEAVVHFSEAIRLKPQHAEAHNNLGFVLTGQGRLEEAIAHLAEAIRLKPDYIEAHNNLGAALAKQGKFDQAISHYSTAREIEANKEKGDVP